MASVVDIYNLALMRMGVNTTVATTDEASVEARACTTFYEQCRDFMLRDFPWSFARRRLTLSQTSDTAPTNWQYVYAYPSNCMKILGFVMPGTRKPIIPQQIEYELASNGTVRVIYCDIATPELMYTEKVTDPARFDPLFVSALAYFLAAEICMPLRGKQDVAQAMRQAYMQTMVDAARVDASETFSGPEPYGELLQIRNGSVLYPYPTPPWQAFPSLV